MAQLLQARSPRPVIIDRIPRRCEPAACVNPVHLARHSGERRNPESQCLDSGLRRSDDRDDPTRATLAKNPKLKAPANVRLDERIDGEEHSLKQGFAFVYSLGHSCDRDVTLRPLPSPLECTDVSRDDKAAGGRFAMPAPFEQKYLEIPST